MVGGSIRKVDRSIQVGIPERGGKQERIIRGTAGCGSRYKRSAPELHRGGHLTPSTDPKLYAVPMTKPIARAGRPPDQRNRSEEEGQIPWPVQRSHVVQMDEGVHVES